MTIIGDICRMESRAQLRLVPSEFAIWVLCCYRQWIFSGITLSGITGNSNV